MIQINLKFTKFALESSLDVFHLVLCQHLSLSLTKPRKNNYEAMLESCDIFDVH